MLNNNNLLALFCMVLTYASFTSAFFINWGSPEPAPVKVQQGHPQWPVSGYYQQRYLQQPQYTYTGNGENGMPMPIPAIPIQVPLQAQLSPAAGVQNVQLVPCVCPMAPDFEYDKQDGGPVFVSQIKNMQPAH